MLVLTRSVSFNLACEVSACQYSGCTRRRYTISSLSPGHDNMPLACEAFTVLPTPVIYAVEYADDVPLIRSKYKDTASQYKPSLPNVDNNRI